MNQVSSFGEGLFSSLFSSLLCGIPESCLSCLFLGVEEGGASPWCVSASETPWHKCAFVCGRGMCVCFPLPNGHFHLLGPDGVLRPINNGVEIQSCLSEEAVVAATRFPSLPLPPPLCPLWVWSDLKQPKTPVIPSEPCGHCTALFPWVL